jgi:hypothetical protein
MTVEELTEKIVSDVEFYWLQNKVYDEALAAKQRVADLITSVDARARQEGRAEGAEQMRLKIVAESTPCRLSEKSHCWIYRIDDPILAPKEKP